MRARTMGLPPGFPTGSPALSSISRTSGGGQERGQVWGGSLGPQPWGPVLGQQ